MTIERIAITDRKMWLDHRMKDVTASDAAALFGAHEFKTAYELWGLKTGRISEDKEETPAMQRGRLLEPVAVQLLREKYPTWEFATPAVYLRDPEARVGATPDLFVNHPERGPGIIQIKSVEPSRFRKVWVDDAGNFEPPLWIAIQASIEASLAGVSWAAVAPFRVGFGVHIDALDVPLSAPLMDRIREKVDEFWSIVDSGKEMPPDYGRDGEALAEIYSEDDGTTIDLSTDNRIHEIVAEDAQLRRQASQVKKARDALKAEVIHKLGTHTFGRLGAGRQISFKPQHTKSYTVAARTTRVLRYPKDDNDDE